MFNMFCLRSFGNDRPHNKGRAGENPTLEAKITIIRQSASEIINIISSVSKCLAFLSRVGMKNIHDKPNSQEENQFQHGQH
jgi:hypothetical protein